ncbi:MAG: sigma-70 family RNA polymerase sigma factor, partial [Planctomycetota bacterium]
MQQTPSVSIESLLTHDNFLRSLARTLITDPSSADDASQDAWVAALKRPPRSDSPRGWIATVVRNFVKQQFRARTRRETHERRAMRGVCVPSTAEIVVKEEIRRQVVEAVLLLDEHYRSVLLLRFYENLAPREIAEYYQIPVATVHTRIQRGLAILRTKLQKSYGSNWSCAVAALVPSLTWGGAGAAGSFIPAALLLQAKHMIAAAVAVVAIASATFVYLWIPPENTAGEIVSNGILGTAQDRELSNLENENDSLDATVPTSTESRRVSAGASEISNNSFMVRGRIVDPEGAPVANANIQFTLKRHLSDVFGPESVKSETTEVSTNANGNFELPIPNRDQSISYFSGLIKVQSESFASIRVDIYDIKSNASNSDLGNITVLQGATVRGRVLDANDRPTGHEWSVGANLRNLSPRIHAENCYVWP